MFESLSEAPFLKLVGDSVPKWLEGWVDSLERGEHELVQHHDGAFFVSSAEVPEEDEEVEEEP